MINVAIWLSGWGAGALCWYLVLKYEQKWRFRSDRDNIEMRVTQKQIFHAFFWWQNHRRVAPLCFKTEQQVAAGNLDEIAEASAAYFRKLLIEAGAKI